LPGFSGLFILVCRVSLDCSYLFAGFLWIVHTWLSCFSGLFILDCRFSLDSS
jgi:hypothetical protein